MEEIKREKWYMNEGLEAEKSTENVPTTPTMNLAVAVCPIFASRMKKKI